jgi:hypothetical protein
VVKHRISPFVRTDLETLLSANGIDTLNAGTIGLVPEGRKFKSSSDRHSRLMKRTQSARIKAPSKGIGEGVATLLQVYRSRSFMKTCQAGRRRAPPW